MDLSEFSMGIGSFTFAEYLVADVEKQYQNAKQSEQTRSKLNHVKGEIFYEKSD